MSDEPSLLDALLTSNDVPPPPVAEHVRRCLHEAETELDKLIAQLRTIEQRACVLGHKIAQYNAILSPARSLPDDILREIFSLTLESFNASPSVKQKNVPPVLLTHICHRWRLVAHSTPALWRKISVKFPQLFTVASTADGVTMKVAEEFVSQQVNLFALQGDHIQEWLQRSGALSLSLHIYQFIARHFTSSTHHRLLYLQSPELPPEFPQQLSRTFELISTYLPRCERLTLDIRDPDVFDLFTTYVTPERIAGIKHFEPGFPCSNDTTTPLFTSLPALRSLHISHRVSRSENLGMFTPDIWKSLTTLKVTAAITLAKAAAVLQRCPSLVLLQLSIVHDDSVTAQQQTSAKEYLMTALQYLSVDFTPLENFWPHHASNNIVGGRLYHISAPNLQTLQYQFKQDLMQDDEDSAFDFTAQFPLDFVLRSAKRLTHLNVSSRKVQGEGFRRVLQETGSQLTHLVFHGKRDDLTLPNIAFQHFTGNGDDAMSEMDSVFRVLFPLPEWCRLSSFAAPVPLMDIDGLDTDELDTALDDQICLRLEHLELPRLYSLRGETLLSLIVYRLRLYEYALHLREAVNAGKDLPLRPLKSLTATIMGTSDQELYINQSVQNLAAVVGVSFILKVDYPAYHPGGSDSGKSFETQI